MISIKTKEKDYQLRLTTKGCIQIENRIGNNPLNIFMEASENKLPKIYDLMIILHECLLPLNHGISLDDVYDIYDNYCNNGGDLVKLIELLVSVFNEAGFLPKDKDTKN